MIKAFGVNDRDFTSNGDAVIMATRALVHNTDNGDFYLDLECSTNYIDYVGENKIIVCPTPKGEQAFRVKTSEVTRNKIKVKAYHISYDAEEYLIEDSYVKDKDCNEALNHLNAATDNPSPFTVSSDVTTIASYRCVRNSLLEAFNTVVSRWGGHIVRDNYNFQIKQQIGTDNGVTIQYGKNLKEITCSYNWANVCTKLLPVGKDGYLLDERYLYSDIQYSIPYTRAVNFDQDINEEDYPDEASYKAALRADLIAQGEAYLNANKYPEANYKVNAIVTFKVDIGDIVVVYDNLLGVNLTSSVISYEYNPLIDRFTSVEFGTLEKTLGDLLGSISASVSSAINENTQIITQEFNGEISKVYETIDKNNDYIFIGSEDLLTEGTLKAPGKKAIVGAFGYNLIRGLFSGVTIPEDMERAYRLTAQVNTNNSNYGAVSINNFKSNRARTWSVTSLRGVVSTNIFKESALVLDKVVNYNQNGLNICLHNEGAAGQVNIYNITIQGYLVKKSTTIPSLSIPDIDLSNGVSQIAAFIQAEDGNEIDTENGEPILIEN